ncbi:hypothetical protein BRARA_D01834 [Brassica rapa]|uniref:Uncharacterized protein n=1 Tax=Brassica campestris TaxID=3711 RepID=A0A397ZQU3_BRACM|nr:hypothetical protein BRARA_D01834 [Brassica rapa]
MSLDDPQTESIHMLNRSSMCVPEFKSNNDKTTFSQILLITSIGLLLALALHYRLRKIRHSKNIPQSDVIYRALSSRGHADMIKTAEFVHQSSTDAASSLLVTALNEGRDVIMDGTLSWVPFVVQTITMTRNVHRHRYRMGAGYKVGENGDVIENYWERIGERQQLQEDGKERKPYRIELVGVVCDAYLAVIRGIRRAIMCRRAVRVRSQLTSHKRFADAFLTYCNIVDNARLYCTNALEGSPKMIAWKEKEKTLLVDPEEIDCLKNVGRLNENAESIYELYRRPNPACEAGSIWKDIVLSPSRFNIQQELKYSIQKVERFKQCLQDTPNNETRTFNKEEAKHVETMYKNQFRQK